MNERKPGEQHTCEQTLWPQIRILWPQILTSTPYSDLHSVNILGHLLSRIFVRTCDLVCLRHQAKKKIEKVSFLVALYGKYTKDH